MVKSQRQDYLKISLHFQLNNSRKETADLSVKENLTTKSLVWAIL